MEPEQIDLLLNGLDAVDPDFPDGPPLPVDEAELRLTLMEQDALLEWEGRDDAQI